LLFSRSKKDLYQLVTDLFEIGSGIGEEKDTARAGDFKETIRNELYCLVSKQLSKNPDHRQFNPFFKQLRILTSDPPQIYGAWLEIDAAADWNVCMLKPFAQVCSSVSTTCVSQVKLIKFVCSLTFNF